MGEPGVEGRDRVGVAVAARCDPDDLPASIGVGLRAAQAEQQSAGLGFEVGECEVRELGAAQRAGEAEQDDRGVSSRAPTGLSRSMAARSLPISSGPTG